ncbi:MAG: hypothetical protein RH945_05950 [Hyphomonas sp.]
MSDDSDPNWARQLSVGGAIFGAIIGYMVLSRFFNQPDATAAEAYGRTVASTMIGILAGVPAGALLGFGAGKLFDILKIKH